MTANSPGINLPRLKKLLEGINKFGFNAGTGGYNRTGFSDADMAVRDWFGKQMRANGLEIRTDSVGNLFGRYGPPDGPCVIAGSHLDTVPEGGAFDGSLGTAIALESVCAIAEAGMVPKIAIEVVATAEEEGRFGGMLGSQAMVGKATPEWLNSASDSDGIGLAETMRAKGFEPDRVADSVRDPSKVRAFLELHVEQGPTLEESKTAIGIVDAISGVCNVSLRFRGVANHSGTTPMNGRHDAFAGMALVATAIPGIIDRCGSETSRMTIGKLDVHPNFPHTIPGEAECIVNIRDTDKTAMRAMAGAVRREAEAAASRHGLELEVEQKSWLPPVKLDGSLVAMLAKCADSLGLDYRVMASGAGHDAQTMQSLCPSALIFVPSRNGISHSPQEWTDWRDIEKGARLYLSALLELTGK